MLDIRLLDIQVLKREAILAIGLVVLLLGSMTLATGSYPPMVVVESGSMSHDTDGSVGAIDPGDLVLVMNPNRVEIITYLEATKKGGEHEGYETHGMAGDVIVYRKNGGNDTPVIHRALLKAVANPEGGWDVPGTDIVGVSEITIELDYDCFHGNTKLTIERWVPAHEGYLTTGDNKWSNGCQIDQLRARYPDLSEQQIRGQGLKDEHGQPVQAVKDEWVVGVASLELPWIGAIKLWASGTGDQVPSRSWSRLLVVIASIITAPVVLEMITDRISGSRSDSDDELGSTEEE